MTNKCYMLHTFLPAHGEIDKEIELNADNYDDAREEALATLNAKVVEVVDKDAMDDALHHLVDRLCSNLIADPDDVEDLVFHWASENGLT